MDSPKLNTAEVYKTVAELLPQEGRDFNLKLAVNEDGKQSVLLEGLTPMGNAWLPFLRDRLSSPMKEKGFGVEHVGPGAQNNQAATVNTVRKTVTAEFDAKLQARIKDQETVAAKFREAIKSGTDTEAAGGLRTAEREIARLKDIQAKVQAIRKTVTERAVRAAEYDRQAGSDRSVDLDAPLKSLFEQADVDTRLRRAETAIEQMAEHAVALDQLGNSAVHELKQYSLPKGK